MHAFPYIAPQGYRTACNDGPDDAAPVHARGRQTPITAATFERACASPTMPDPGARPIVLHPPCRCGFEEPEAAESPVDDGIDGLDLG